MKTEEEDIAMNRTGMESMDGDGDGDGMEPLPRGADIYDDLSDALSANQFPFQGYFYHFFVDVKAPNPCIRLSSGALVSLPFQPQQIYHLIDVARFFPMKQEHDESKNVKIEEGSPCRLDFDADRIEFMNPFWKEYTEAIKKKTAAALGINLNEDAVRELRIQLRELRLCAAGTSLFSLSDSISFQDSAATILVLLPSAYTGGAVTVSCPAPLKPQVFDFSEKSAFSTAHIAAYHGLRVTSQPVISGHQLALLYTLEAPSPDCILPIPTPVVYSKEKLQRMFQNWRRNAYKPDNGFLIQPLDHYYDPAALKNEGIERHLKGIDRQRLAILKDIAEPMGYVLCPGTMQCRSCGIFAPKNQAGNSGGEDSRDGDKFDANDSSRVNKRKDVVSGTISIIGRLADLQGTLPMDPCLEYAAASQLWTRIAKGIKETPGLVHNCRTVIMVYHHTEDVDAVAYSIGGISYALAYLTQRSGQNPSVKETIWTTRLLEDAKMMRKEEISTLLDYAMKWKDVDIWNWVVVNARECTAGVLGTSRLVRAWRTFGFKASRSSLKKVVERTTSMNGLDRITFIFRAPQSFTADERANPSFSRWWRRRLEKALLYMTIDADKSLSSVLVQLAMVVGLGPVKEHFLPNILRNNTTFDILLRAAETVSKSGQKFILQQQKLSKDPIYSIFVPASQDLSSDAAVQKVLREIIKCLLECASLNCFVFGENVTEQPFRPLGAPAKPKLLGLPTYSKIGRLLQLAVTSGHTDVLDKLFKNRLIEILIGQTSDEEFTENVKSIIKPLVHDVCFLLKHREISVSEEPFRSLFRNAIGAYLQGILGQKDEAKDEIQAKRLRKVGCGRCRDCDALDDFISWTGVDSHSYHLTTARKHHLEVVLSRCKELCTFETENSCFSSWLKLHNLKITKTEHIKNCVPWRERVWCAENFLNSIGSREEIQRIMGTRYGEVLDALNGTQPFRIFPTSDTSHNLRKNGVGGSSAADSAHDQASDTCPPPSSQMVEALPRAPPRRRTKRAASEKDSIPESAGSHGHKRRRAD
ncbi:hypothetical protein D9613_008488 [Agrocybe pediades]|uniref:Uncharacterized protein n=1 Tax=Agrocybe pediades TaxID=84607 RepID=A0A8H4QSQ0_9AGAR|nr:hypothetical protein D9613_008488 [Agrocybe pediades]